MEYHEQADDDRYTIGIAAFVCVLPLPVIYLVIRPLLVLMCDGPWIPRLLLLFAVVLPLSMAFIILYYHAWYPKWPRPKRVLLSALLSCLIFGTDLFLIAYVLAAIFVFGNCFIRGG
jgi:hypothetical protein